MVRIFLIFILIDLSCRSNVEKSVLPEPLFIESINECKCILKNKIDNFILLDSFTNIIMHNSNCKGPSYGVFQVHFSVKEIEKFEIDSVLLFVCNDRLVINDIKLFKETLYLDHPLNCMTVGLGCSKVKVNLDYQ